MLLQHICKVSKYLYLQNGIITSITRIGTSYVFYLMVRLAFQNPKHAAGRSSRLGKASLTMLFGVVFSDQKKKIEKSSF